MKAYMFAGQGAQFPGMAAELSENTAVKKLWKLADSISPGIIETMLHGTAEQLAQTVITQPTMYIADLSYALAADDGGKADAVCGFSVGEIPALAYAGAFSHEDGFKIILKRAQLMQEASGAGGAMVAVIGLDAKTVEDIALSAGEAWAVNYNAPTQTVVACSEQCLSELNRLVGLAKGRAIKLNVSGAFHCKYMQSAASGLAEFLSTIKISKPTIPVFANLTAKPYGDDVIKTLSSQVCSPVLFNKTVLNMQEFGITQFVEVGAGKVLSGLIKKIIG